ncbi:MAG TPA: aspartate carbamoyltransferase catalytic subunit [Polyangia bacterium]|jgi:aspartate carbamoyltransferase catalytic subunit|nr:aspartate carbamoyltransferase catalytic subunit [Polyangia bacterium]
MEPLGAAEIAMLLDLGDRFLEINERPIKKVPTLRGKTVINLFLEPSTRTRTSFEIAAKRLSADAVNISGSASSTVKGETLLDTARNLDAMAPDVVVVRHAQAGAAEMLAGRLRASVVNAGDGAHEHPTQALLDCSTIRKHKGRIDGLEVVICGDIRHSRVARSNIWALTKLGARVRIVAPRTLLAPGLEAMGAPGSVSIHERLEPALEGADVIMMLRIQKERIGGALFPNTREYSRYFGLNPRRLALAKPDAIVMHPGPLNRGIEIDPAVADGPRAVILDQVARGVAVRMAVLYLLAGGDAGPSE